MSISDTIQEYRAIRPTYERFCVKTQQLLCDLLGAEGIAFQVIEGRAKTPERFAEKPERAGKSYEAPLEDVTDLAGLRIILYGSSGN